jgi:energy-coupling factor transport system ATP-binding protein
MSDAGGLTIDGLSVRYLGRKVPALEDVSLAVSQGSVVSVAGRTGAGKSTLALAASGFVPRVVRAHVSGSVLVDGIEASGATLAQLAGKVGVVFSAPALQLSASKPTVREELAFGLENLAVPRREMDERIDAVLDRLGIAHLADREPLALSGGEQQRVAIASILVMGTRLIVLDEPAAQLDPGGTEELASLLGQLAADGRAVLVTEHAPEVLAAARECLVLESGRVVARGVPAQALGSQPYAPTMVRLAAAAGVTPEQAFDEQVVADSLRDRPISRPTSDREPTHQVDVPLDVPTVRGAKAQPIDVRGLVHRYPGGVTAVRGVDLTIAPGETVAIVGQNGSGKTTLAKHFNGLLRPDAGSVSLGGRDVAGLRVSDLAGQVGFVFQNPDDQLFNSRVDREIGFGPRNLRLPSGDVDSLVEVALAMVGLTDERATNPYDLGFSLRKLVALASVLAMESPVLVLDEPTTGQDGPGVARVGSIVDAWAGAGRTVVAITHDMEFAARHFRRVVVMRQGEIVLDDAPGVVFSVQHTGMLASTGLRPPPASRIAALLGLGDVPADADELLRLLARRSPGG